MFGFIALSITGLHSKTICAFFFLILETKPKGFILSYILSLFLLHFEASYRDTVSQSRLKLMVHLCQPCRLLGLRAYTITLGIFTMNVLADSDNACWDS